MPMTPRRPFAPAAAKPGRSAASNPRPLGEVAPKATAAPAVEAPTSGNYVFKLPDVGEGTAEAELVGWHVKVGDAVEEDQIIADIMTDKATVEITSPVAGTVVALYGEPGKSVPVGGPLVAFDVEGRGNVSFTPVAAPKPASKPTENATTASAAISTAQRATSATALSSPFPP
jgi:2-oxoisovalerate dehydrogenase E2 component (dihydrolipoyl transacylase)